LLEGKVDIAATAEYPVVGKALAMEDEARWMIANYLTNETAVPDFRKYMYTEGLNTVKPGSVHIIG
jgi:hypothetical protein